MQDDIMVSVCCVTYNHKDFIKKALDGFVMQKTNFKFEVLVHDDASTDGTTEIIKEYKQKYPDIIKPIYQKENQFSKSICISKTFLWPKAKGKYLAFCEGDDYWTDENKIQIQVDYMEAHPDLSGCFHKSLRKDVIDNKDICYKPTEEELKGKTKFDVYDVQKSYFIETCSAMYRWDIYKEELLKCYPDGIVNGDSFIINFFAIHGKIGYIDKLMSVKNIGNQGVWNSKAQMVDDRNIKYAYEIINFPVQLEKLYEKYNLSAEFCKSKYRPVKKVIMSALNKERYDIIEKVSREFPDIVRELIHTPKSIEKLEQKIQKYEQESQKYKQKYKKYKKMTYVFAIISIVLLISIFVIFITMPRGA